MPRWEIVHEIVNNLGKGWDVDASGPQDLGHFAGLASGPGGMRLFFIARNENLDPCMERTAPPRGWLRVDGRLRFSDEDVSAKLSLVLPESLTAEEMANEIALRMLPLYTGFLDVVRKHDFRGRKIEPTPQTEHAFPTSANREAGVDDHKPDEKIVTEQEVALSFIRSMLQRAQEDWPTIHASFKDTFRGKFVVADEATPAFDLYLAAVALHLQAVSNLFSAVQADRIEKWVLKCIGGTRDWGEYAIGEVREYGAAFQNEATVDNPLSAIPARLLHRWLGANIRNFDTEINGEKTGIINHILVLMTMEVLNGFVRTWSWKGIKNNFTVVKGDMPLD